MISVRVSCEPNNHLRTTGSMAPQFEIFESNDRDLIMDMAKQRGWVFSISQELYARTNWQTQQWPATCAACAANFILEKSK